MRDLELVDTPPRALTALGTATAWAVVLETYLLAKVDNKNTERAYRRLIREALEQIGRPTLGELSGLDLAAYRRVLLSQGQAPKSSGLALTALRSFLKWARRPHVGACPLALEVIEDALSLPHSHVIRPYCVPSNPELREMLNADNPRDRAIVAVLAGGGLRVAELVALDVGDIHEDPEGCAYLHIRCGKGSKDRLVPIREEIVALIRAYLEASERTMADCGPLFLTHDPGAGRRGVGRISTRAVRELVRVRAQRAGVTGKAISPHSLRHQFALRSLRSGGNVVALSKVLGHSQISTTQRYLEHLETADLLLAVPPLPV